MKDDDRVYPDNISLTKGLTVRDHIAIQAMKSFAITAWHESDKRSQNKVNDNVVAEAAYRLADAMIAESEK